MEKFKSPTYKLLAFFEKSRDKWKSKYLDLKYTVKKLQYQVRYHKERKKELKNRIKELENELSALKQEKNQVEENTVKKKDDSQLDPFSVLVPYHSYSLGHIELYLKLVLFAMAPLRCASRAMGVFFEIMKLDVGVPSWSSGRLWLLRLGYFKLTRPKEQASDWVWIIDHTIQLGSEKGFVILGIRLSALSGRCLTLRDMEPIDIIPVKTSNGAVVFEQLEGAAQKTGIPRQIVSDHGSDLVAGLDMFCNQHPDVSATYDIKHKTAAVLKRELQSDERWQSFLQMCTWTAQRTRQTDLAFLCPPNQRSKSRYMNADILVRWGAQKLSFLDSQLQVAEVDRDNVEEKFGWLKGYREEIKGWEALLEITSSVESFVRSKGLHKGCHKDLQKQLVCLAITEQSKRVRSELLFFVAQESSKAKPGEVLVGSSEVIESSFGKQKNLEGNHATGGFTSLLLALGAIVAPTTTEVIQKALEAVRTKEIRKWCKEKLGKTIQAKKHELGVSQEEEQKLDEILMAASM